MENKSHALMAGLFTIALIVAAVLAGVWLNRDRTEWVPYEIATTLSVTGLNPQAIVRYRGLQVGRVDKITFDPAVPGQMLVRISVSPATPITQSTFATLGYQGVTGIAYVQLDDDNSRPVRLSSSAGRVARIGMRPSILAKLENSSNAILLQAEELTRRLNSLLSPANQKVMLTAFENINKTAVDFQAIPQQMAPTLEKMPAMADQAHRALGSLATLSTQASALTGQLTSLANGLQAPQGPLSSMLKSIGAAADRLEFETLPRVNSLVDDAQALMRPLNRSITNLNERPQSILFGAPTVAPGPGESGFSAPSQ
jgi:phospholipid/cholesterol/gamma-HCH transport system substrate-binding protein